MNDCVVDGCQERDSMGKREQEECSQGMELNVFVKETNQRP